MINLSYFKADGTEVVVYCPESRNSPATQNPRDTETAPIEDIQPNEPAGITQNLKPLLREKRIKVLYGDTGYSYETLFKDYLTDASEIILEDSYIRQKHQISNLLRLCELLVKMGSFKKITLITGYDDEQQKRENEMVFEQIADSLFEHEIEFRFEFSSTIHDREMKINNGWNIKMGRGLDYFQSLSGNYYQVGVNDLDLRPCLETSFDFYRS